MSAVGEQLAQSPRFAGRYSFRGTSSPGVPLWEPLPEPTGAGQPWVDLLALLAQASRLRGRAVLDRIILLGMMEVEGTGSERSVIFPLVEFDVTRSAEDEPLSARSIAETIASIRASLSLQIKELAEIVGVERPTIYAWINGHSTPRPYNRDRLGAIYRLAKHWDRISAKPIGRAMHDLAQDGISIFNCLRRDPIPEDDVLRRFRAIGQSSAPTRKPPSVRELASQHGIDLASVRDQQDELDVLTGKRFDAE